MVTWGMPFLLMTLQAEPQPEAELQSTFFLLILGVAAAGIFLWLIMSRFSRPP
jgi:hypothetical protein